MFMVTSQYKMSELKFALKDSSYPLAHYQLVVSNDLWALAEQEQQLSLL